jgi:hypothetical protein
MGSAELRKPSMWILDQIDQRFPSFHACIPWAYDPKDLVFCHPFNVIINIDVQSGDSEQGPARSSH